ncbi:XRE family transcriptional regulator [Mycetocola tolaasinivorans]|uniref:XRE family transcriptional regulator n=1 Tax=Mycetocola tolaasinivorans TaxID=76635 RepID=A0A3L7A867_9MICO|nr:helix-turn-helix transcriptional regulator [Mycetocola tolaasinivorans]RLP75562.1 XRE family transcriptional regulator [Mycetocola tolaasinivorans]
MDSRRTEIKTFLASRRARISPEDAGVPTFGGTRRVPGLRREEVAHLAGVSVDYYARIERGHTAGVSPEVLDAIAGALRLTEAEHEHLFDLVDATRPVSPGRRTPRRGGTARVSQNLQLVLDAMDIPAFVQNVRGDHVASNAIGRALYGDPGDDPAVPFNYSRFVFLNPRATAFYRDLDRMKHNNVALLRQAVGRAPQDEGLQQLVGELSTSSAEFARLWASHDVLRYRSGTKRYHHALVGDIEFGYETFEVTGHPELLMLVYTVEPASPTAEAMQLLANWSLDRAVPAPRQSADAAIDQQDPDLRSV